MKRGYTTVKKHKTVYEWTIEEVSSYIELAKTATNDVELYSPEFTSAPKFSWNLNLMFYSSAYPTERDRISLYLYSLNKNDGIKTKFLLYISKDNQKVNLINGSHIFQNINNNESQGSPDFVKKAKLLKPENELMPNDTLTVGVELIVYDENTAVSISTPLNKKKSSMVDDYKAFFNSGAGSDIVINVGCTQFKAHKSILMIRSPVFFAMFSTDMKENKENSITVRDVESEIFHCVLEFIYTDQVTDLDENAEKLLEASELFQLLSLKEMCIESLCQSMNHDNAAKMLVLADRFNAKEMLEYSAEFIVANSKYVVKTEGYKKMKESNPSLTTMLFEKFATF